jgi:hypothetical protein
MVCYVQSKREISIDEKGMKLCGSDLSDHGEDVVEKS